MLSAWSSFLPKSNKQIQIIVSINIMINIFITWYQVEIWDLWNDKKFFFPRVHLHSRHVGPQILCFYKNRWCFYISKFLANVISSEGSNKSMVWDSFVLKLFMDTRSTWFWLRKLEIVWFWATFKLLLPLFPLS